MSFRNKRLATESIGSVDDVRHDNGGELLVAPAQVDTSIGDALGLRSEIEISNDEITELADATEVAQSDVETLEAMEDGLSDETREVSEEEAATIKMVTEGFARRYGFDMPRELGTESFGADLKDNRAIALKYVQAAKLGTEGFITDAVMNGVEKVGKFIENVVGVVPAMTKVADALVRAADKTTSNNVGEISGDSLTRSAGTTLTHKGVFIGSDLGKMRELMKANLDEGYLDLNIDEGVIKAIKAAGEAGKLDDVKSKEDILSAVPELKSYIDAQEKALDAVEIEDDGTIEIIGNQGFRLPIKEYAKSSLWFILLGGSLLGGGLALLSLNKKYKKLAAVEAIQPPQAKDYAAFMHDLGGELKKSKIFGAGSGRAVNKALNAKKDALIEELADSVPASAMKTIKSLMTIDEELIGLITYYRVQNLTAMVNGTIDYASLSMKAYK